MRNNKFEVLFVILLATVVLLALCIPDEESEDFIRVEAMPIDIQVLETTLPEESECYLSENHKVVENVSDDYKETIKVVPTYYDIDLSVELQDYVRYCLDYMDIDLDETYIFALMYHESKFDPYAVGSSGDSGYCQIVERYFDDVYDGLCTDFPEFVESEGLPRDVFNEKTNIACGIFWLNKSAERISGKGVTVDNITSALTAYNRGVKGASDYFKAKQTYVTSYSSSVLEIADAIRNGNQKFPE